MTTITLAPLERQYRNNGQHAEQVFRFTFTGKRMNADNKPSTLCGDYADIQIKSARATICRGTDIKAHVAADKANRYAYVTADCTTAYIMSKAEWIEFATKFATVTTESPSSGMSGYKTRLKSEGKAIRRYLETRV